MHDVLTSKLNDLDLNEKWVRANIVDKAFVEKWHAKLPGTDAQHIRIKAECSHVPIRSRERKVQRFRSIRSAQKLLSAHGPIYNLFNIRRHLTSRNIMKILRNRAMAN